MATGTLLITAAIISAAATAYTVRQQNMTGKRMATIQGQQADAQAKQLELQVQAERTQAEVDELDRQRTLERIISAQNAVFGSTGLATTSGSFTNIQTQDFGRASQASRLNQLFTDTRQIGYRASVASLYNQAALSRSANRVARRTNTIQGIGSIISTGASAYAGYNASKPTPK